jgi:hypothetical protein
VETHLCRTELRKPDLGAAPIYPLYRRLKKRPLSSAVAVVLFRGTLIFVLIYVVWKSNPAFEYLWCANTSIPGRFHRCNIVTLGFVGRSSELSVAKIIRRDNGRVQLQSKSRSVVDQRFVADISKLIGATEESTRSHRVCNAGVVGVGRSTKSTSR